MLAVLALVCTVPTILFALDPAKAISQYGHDIWLRQSGLPSNSVSAIVQTRDGYLWLGTPGGLYRFDGVSFTWMAVNPTRPNSHESISALCQTRDGSLWVGTGFNSVFRIRDGVVKRFSGPEGVMAQNILTLYESPGGQLWLGTTDGLYRFEQERFEPVIVHPPYVESILEDSLGRIWLANWAGVHVIDHGREVAVPGLDVAETRQPVHALLRSRTGEIWIGGEAGVMRWRNGKLTLYTMKEGIRAQRVSSLFEDRDGNIWAGAGGLCRFRNGTWTSFGTREGLTGDIVACMVEDHEGSLWIGTGDGLDRLKDGSVTMLTSHQGLSSEYITGVAGSGGGTVCVLSAATATIDFLRDGTVRPLKALVGVSYTARDGSLWIGQTGQLLHVRGESVTRYTAKDGLPVRWISAIGEDREGLLLAIDGLGVRRFSDGKTTPFMLRGGVQYLNTTYVGTIFLEPDGTLWIAHSCGLERIKDGELTDYGKDSVLSHFWVNAIATDGKGSLWFVSPTSGLARFRNGTFTYYTTREGLFSNELYCVVLDNQGDLWLTSSRGIGYVRQKDVNDFDAGRIPAIPTRMFTTDDGLKSDVCFGSWQSAAWKAPDGRLWFATYKGVAVIDPRVFRSNPLAPATLIEQVVVDQQPLSPGTDISIPAGSRSLEIHYTALSFLVPDRVRFRYRLEGFDENWVEAGTRRTAFYTGLPPGHYRFHVMACNNDGVWNEAGGSVSLTMEPHFYQTAWFLALAAGVSLAAMFGLYRLRMAAMRRRAEVLARQVDERTRELTDQRSFLRRIIDLNPSFIFSKDRQGRFRLANRALAEAYGATAEELVGKSDGDFNKDPDQVEKFLKDDLQVMDSGTEKFIPEEEFTDVKGVRHWKQVIKIPIIGEDGKAELMLGVATDITERKRTEELLNASLKEKEILLKEIHHRIKNNLQVISSLLNLQAGRVKDDESREAFEESVRRVRTMAMVHQDLYSSDDIAHVDMAHQVPRLVGDLAKSYSRLGVSVKYHVDPVKLEVDKAIPCGLILSEVMTNAFKHAFPDGRGGTITVALRRKTEELVELTVQDDGIGIPDPAELRKSSSMGMTVVHALSQQMGGNLSFDGTGGTLFTLTFPG